MARWVDKAQAAADKLEGIRVRLAPSRLLLEAARATLAEAVRQLRDESDAGDILLDGVSALVPAGADRLPAATIHAAAMLADGLLSGEPQRAWSTSAHRGLSAARDLIASVYSIPPNAQMARGLLQLARRHIRRIIHAHTRAVFFFVRSAPHLGVQPGDQTAWSGHKDHASDELNVARERLDAAILQAVQARNFNLLCYMTPAEQRWQCQYKRDTVQRLLATIQRVDVVLPALCEVGDAIAREESIVLRTIRAVGPAP